MKVVSLASANITINNSNRGDIISFGGGGKQIGSISYGFTDNIFDMSTTKDGGYAASHSASRAGTITISFSQTSEHIDTLCEYILWCRDNPELAGAGITIADSTGIINMEAKDCVPQNDPQNELGESITNRQFTFLCGVIIPKEYVAGGNK